MQVSMTPNRIRKRRRSSSFISPTIIAGCCCCCPAAPFASPSSRCGAFQPPPRPPHLLGWSSRNNRDHPTSSHPSSSSPPPRRGGGADRPPHRLRNRLGNSSRRSRPPPPPRRLRATTTGGNDDDDDDDGGGGGGSVLGASLLFAGTAVGAGLLALPAETSDAGFAPSIVGLLFCWAYTYVTSLVTLEASWLSSAPPPREDDEGGGGGGVGGGGGDGGGAGFLSISRMSLGPVGEAMTASLFWFLLTAIIVAYASEGGTLISRTAGGFVDPGVGSMLFAMPFAYLAVRGTSGVDVVNRILVFGLVASFVGLVGFGLPNVEVSNLMERANWAAVYPRVISIGILSLGAQNVVPTLLRYLDRDPLRTRTAILFGSLLPLTLYAIWEAIFLGVVVDPSSYAADGGTGVEAMAALGQVGGKAASDLVGAFSFCAVGSSMAGASVSLVDFFQDGIRVLMSGGDSASGVSSPSSSGEDSRVGKNLESRTFAAALALGPPVVIACAYPDMFLVALEEAGLLGAVSLYGVIPAISILSLRHNSSSEVTCRRADMPGRLGGGDFALIVLVAASLALVLPEIRYLL